MGKQAVEAFGPILARLEADPAGYLGSPDATLSVEGVLERPFSTLLRLHVRASGRTFHAYVKRYKPKAPGEEAVALTRARVIADYTTSGRVWGALAGSSRFAAVRPIACFANDLTVVTEEVPGETMTALLERDGVWAPTAEAMARLEAVSERVGEWIRRFQGTASPGGRFSLGAMREYLDVRLGRIVASGVEPFGERDRAALLSWFDDRASEVDEAELVEVPVHADVCPANVLVDGSTIALIDFAMVSSGGIYHDVARMFTQLDFLRAKPKFRPEVVARLQAALLRGFDPALAPDRPLFELFLLQHTITQFMKLAIRPGRSLRRLWSWHLRRRHRRWLLGLIAGRPSPRAAVLEGR